MPKEQVRRATLVIGNWKMHGRLVQNASLLTAVASGAAGLNGVRVGVCVPAPYLAQSQALLAGSVVAWGVQDVSSHTDGAYTGEISAEMATDFASTYAIVGHSERRHYHGEQSGLVALKAQRALEAGLTPIVCVGETAEQHEAGLAKETVGAQLDAVLDLLSAQWAAKIVVAYEPVWAIGTGKSATAEQAQAIHAFLRGRLALKGAEGVSVLYGGSVKPDNAAEMFEQPDIDGGLIGGAALKADEFLGICQAAHDFADANG